MPYTDLTYLKDFTGDDPELMQEAVSRYLKKTPHLLDELNKGYKNQDWDKVAFSAHNLFSATQIVGIVAIQGDLRNLENNARNGQSGRELEENLKQVNEAIQASFKELNSQ